MTTMANSGSAITPDFNRNVSKSLKNQHIQAFVRVRPLSTAERNARSLLVVECPSNKDVVVKERPHDKLAKTFNFDRVFGPTSKQLDVYKSVVNPMIEEVLKGYNCTVFAYGQTGTGKTYTMEGEGGRDKALSWEQDPETGIIPRALSQLFDELRLLQVEFTMRISFLELYNEELFDLLSANDDNTKLRLYEDTTRKGSVIIQGLEEVLVHDKNEVYSILERGSQRRQTAATQMNAQSSRSHTVFSITIHIKENSMDGEDLLKTGKLNLVDLAGSENIQRSGAVDKRAREAGNINQSLLTLGRVITSLVERAPHVPYRESKLTRLLQDSLGGRTKTSIIATVSPAQCNLEETLSTLDYAHRAKNITNRPEINQKMSKKTLLKEYTEEIERLRRDLQAAREKSGVYLAHDNYTQMITEIKVQEQEILERINQMKAMKEEMDKKDRDFMAQTSVLEIRSELLENKTQQLLETQEDLISTKKNLKKTTKVCKERDHLITKLVTTEENLTKQAKDILYVADSATDDVHKLHSKLDRKRSVDSSNSVLIHKFQLSFTDKLTFIEDLITKFTSAQDKMCANLRSSLGERLSIRSQEVATVNEQITTMVKMMSESIFQLESKLTEQTQHGQQWSQQFVQTTHKQCDSQANALHVFFSDNFLPTMQSLGHLMHAQINEISTLHRFVLEQIDKQTSMSGVVGVEITDSVNQLREGAKQFALLQEDERRVYEENIKAIQQRKQDYLLDTTTSIDSVVAVLQQVLNQAKANSLVDNATTETVLSRLSRGQEETNNFLSAVEITNSKIDESMKGYQDQCRVEYEATGKGIGMSVDNMMKVITETELKQNDMEQETRVTTSTAQEGWREFNIATELDMRNRLEMESKNLKMNIEQTQSLHTELRNSAQQQDMTLEKQHQEFSTFVKKHNDELDDNCVSLNEWGQSVTNEVRQRDTDMNQFLYQDLRRDIPTGETPNRRSFHYPHELVATSPHERILNRYRLMENIAADDSFTITENTITESRSEPTSPKPFMVPAIIRSNSAVEVPEKNSNDLNLEMITASHDISSLSESSSESAKENKKVIHPLKHHKIKEKSQSKHKSHQKLPKKILGSQNERF